MQQSDRAGDEFEFVELSFSQMKDWRPTVAGIRDAIFAENVGGVAAVPGLDPEAARYAATRQEVGAISFWCQDAVRAGRVIDFGFLPNDVIKAGGQRGGPLYGRGALGQPFRAPWLFVHRWEGDGLGSEAVAVYLVHLVDQDKPAGGEVEIAELIPIFAPFRGPRIEPSLVVGDRGILLEDDEETRQPGKYRFIPIPSIWRFLPGAEGINKGGTPSQAAAGNLLDPLMTALLMLATRGLRRDTVEAPAKLQRARAKSGKPPIPPYDVIESKPYVTAMLARQERQRGGSGAARGTHASPIAHIRMGHIRHMPAGQTLFIADTLVNVSDDRRAAFKSTRSHYTTHP